MSDLRCVDELAERRGVLARHFRLVQDYRRGDPVTPGRCNKDKRWSMKQIPGYFLKDIFALTIVKIQLLN